MSDLQNTEKSEKGVIYLLSRYRPPVSPGSTAESKHIHKKQTKKGQERKEQHENVKDTAVHNNTKHELCKT